MSSLGPTQMRASAAPPLPAAVVAELERLEGRLGQSADPQARQHLSELSEAAAVRVLRKIGENRKPVRTLSGFIMWMVGQERMERNARGIPTAESAACRSGPSRGEETVSGPLNHNDVQMEVLSLNGEIASGLSNHARVEAGSPNRPTHFGLPDNEGSVREIARAVPNLARMVVENPSDRISFELRNQDCVEVDTPVLAMAPLVPNQIPVQINSPVRAMAPAMPNDVMMQVGSPGHCVPFGLHNHMEIDSPNQQIICTPPTSVSTPSPVRDLSRRVQGMVVPSGSPLNPPWAMPPNPATYRVTANALRETASPQMLALEELEFRKIFMIFAYLSGNKIEDVLPEDYEDYIKSLKDLPMADFESQIWNKFGHKYIAASDRAKNLDSDPTTTNIYHCNVEIREDSVVKIFKGPYVENTRTHLQRSVGDDNVLVVKFMEKDTKTRFDIYRQHYHKVAEDGIVLGLRRYRFFIYKDGGKKESFVRCYFIRTESGWNMDEPYILSGRTIGQARKLFMHIHTAPTLAKYMARFALILSKTITLDDLSTVDVRQIDDVPCKDEYGNIVLNRDDEPLIHTDGTGLISQDLALKCPTSIFKGNFLKSHDAAACGALTGSKRRRSHTTEHPLLIQFRMFFNGSAVKGTALVDRRLPPRTILIRPTMIKIKTDPKLSGAQSFNSLEIVSTSNQPKRTSTSRFLIALLHYGGVKAEYFMELLQNAIEEAENTRYDYEDVLKLAFGYADMEDSMSVRMILSGIPIEEAYLQHRLAFIAAQKEGKKIKKGKLPIDDCFYLMGTTDPTGTLLPNEVCVILDNGQLSGDVLVYKHPGLHFGDIHVLTARYISNLEKVVGYSKYAILFPTSGKRSLADEMANSDFDGDMYWVSRNPKLLEHFKPHKPWVQVITPKKTQQKRPQDFDESQLERQLFDEFMKTRFTPSYAIGTAADCWLAYMDRLLTDEVDESEKELIKNKMTKLVDRYYLALDAPKTGNKINIEDDLMIKQYPHFMDQKASSYHSTSILGRIYDEANKLMLLQSENVRSIDISLLPYFTEREASEECNYRWKRRYDEYLGDSKLLIDLPDKEEKDTKFEELYQKYKHMLYNAAEFDQTRRNLDDVFTEACAIYRIVYEKAMANKDIRKCCFAWKVAGHALCHFYALKNEGDTALCSLPVLRKILKKAPR